METPLVGLRVRGERIREGDRVVWWKATREFARWHIMVARAGDKEGTSLCGRWVHDVADLDPVNVENLLARVERPQGAGKYDCKECFRRTGLGTRKTALNAERGGARRRLPFLPRFTVPIREGRKTMTCRSKAYGKPGDVLIGPEGLPLELLEVRRVRLGDVAVNHWREEGCSSAEDFVSVWESIHGVVGFDPEREVVLHVFRLANKGSEEGSS